MKKIFLSLIVFLLLTGTALAQTEAHTTADCQQLYGANFIFNAATNTCRDQSYNPSSGTAGGTNYDCPTGQTWSSTGNSGAGGCVTSPSVSNPATPNYDCPTGQTSGGCVTSPSATTGGSGTTGSAAGIGGGTGAAYTPTSPTTNTSSSGGKLTYTPLEPLGDNTNSDTYNSLSKYLTLIFNLLLSIGAMIAVVSLVIGGITYMLSEVVTAKITARKRITASFIGLGLLLTSWLILYTINPKLVQPCILNLNEQCGAVVANNSSGPGQTTATNNPIPDAATLQKAEAACKSQGPTYSFYVDTSGMSCQNTMAL